MSKLRQRVDFKIDEFANIITQKGYDLIWEKALKCPCLQEERSAQPDYNCSLCHGKGWYWYDQIDIQGAMTSFSENVKYNQTGEVAMGTAYLTVLPENKLGFYDRVTNLDSRIRHSEVLTKGTSEKDSLRFQPTDILYCRSIKEEYIAGKDFKFDPNSFEIEWLEGGLRPNTGDRYSLGYEMPPRWIVIDIINVLRDTQVKAKHPGITFTELPVRALVRLEYFIFGIIDPV
jgi:hypothetical protein